MASEPLTLLLGKSHPALLNSQKKWFSRKWEFLVFTRKNNRKFLIAEFFFELVWLRVPVYHVLFRLKSSTLSGHTMKCLLTEHGRAGRENS